MHAPFQPIPESTPRRLSSTTALGFWNSAGFKRPSSCWDSSWLSLKAGISPARAAVAVEIDSALSVTSGPLTR
jgi:hypothetical protein